jgi:hypothetical protein
MRTNIGWRILAVLFFGANTFAQDIGVTLFRAVTTNLDGSGIPIAQPEGSLDANYQLWQVTPGSTGHAASLFTYASSNGTANVFPNSLGTDSSHADGVGQLLYGIPGGIAQNVARVDSSEANYFISTYVTAASPPNIVDPIVNQSFAFVQLTVSDQQAADSDYDNAAVKSRTLFIGSVNNYGTTGGNTTNATAPGTAYNSIGVGAYSGGTFANGLGPTLDNGRCKPDITAPAEETSGAVPQISGAAAVLMQAALRGDGGSDTNSAFDIRTIKALLLNGAVKTPDWTNSTASPLDMRYGAGVLNVFNAYEQLAGGKQNYIATTSVGTGAAHPPNAAAGTISSLSGWDFNTNTSASFSDVINHYYFTTTNNPANAKFTATLVWNRQKNQSSINNLNLFLFNTANSNLVTCSTSKVDNVEHIYVPQLPPGRYDLQVWKAGGIAPVNIISAAEPYALAWNFVLPPTNPPVLNIAKSGTNVVLSWPILPNGFVVQAATNLNPSITWSTNNLPAPAYTNGQNYLWLNATNAAQFFRLLWP